MRHRVALTTVTLSLVAAGSALAFDVTPVVYDLNSLETDLSAPTATAPMSVGQVRVSSLPMTTPSLDSPVHDGSILTAENGLEEANPNRMPQISPVGTPPSTNPGNGRGRGRGRGPHNPNDPNPNQPNPGHGGNGPSDPTPNPEPGTMLLLGSALATGARYVRRRRSA